MKKKVLAVLLAATMIIGMTACAKTGNETETGTDTTSETETGSETDTTGTEDMTDTENDTTGDTTAEPHEHAYTEKITKEATCKEEGIKTFTCKCGDTKTEAIATIAHVYGDYSYNDDANYEQDGTETAFCKMCGEGTTRTVEGTKKEFTFTDMDKTMYVKKAVNVRALPSTAGKAVGKLKTVNEAVKVTGQCVETKWYRIEYKDGVAYVSNNYLSDTKVEKEPEERPKEDDDDEGAPSKPRLETINGFVINTAKWDYAERKFYTELLNAPFETPMQYPGEKFFVMLLDGEKVLNEEGTSFNASLRLREHIKSLGLTPAGGGGCWFDEFNKVYYYSVDFE